MKNRSDWDDYELPEEYDYSGKEAIRGRFYSPKKKSVTIRLDDDQEGGLPITDQRCTAGTNEPDSIGPEYAC